MKLVRCEAGDVHVLEVDLRAVRLVVAGDEDVARTQVRDVLDGDVLVLRDLISLEAGIEELIGGAIVVVRADGYGHLDLTHADIAVGKVVDEAAAGNVALDANAAGGCDPR